MSSAAAVKEEIRRRVWALLEENGVLAFPYRAFGRIPNFRGSAEAASVLCSTKEFLDAAAVKVNPDSPQREVRKRCLVEGKTLVVPTPRLRHGFLLLEPHSGLDPDWASTIVGAARSGVLVRPEELPKIDLVVLGSVAVSPEGARVGKGEGYAELEYAILRRFGKVSEHTPVFTTIHPLQIVEKIPLEPFDVTVDSYFTPKARFDARGKKSRPKNIIWDLLPENRLEEIPLLAELAEHDGVWRRAASGGRTET